MYWETAATTNVFVNSGGNYLVHAFCNDTCTFALADTVLHKPYNTIFYTTKGSYEQTLESLGANYDGTQSQLIFFESVSVIAKDLPYWIIEA